MKKHPVFPRKKKGLITTLLLVILAGIFFACALYLNDYYRADAEDITQFVQEYEVSKQVLEDGTIVYAPENATTGLIFYPGGKVEYTAYEPLMAACAAEGILCILVEMPFHLAVLDMDAAEGIQAQYPEITHWYMGGHSLGGSMAASYLSQNAEDYEGLILLGSYSTADLSQTDLEVLSIYGSEDQVLNYDNYTENKKHLPDTFTELVIKGGCHAYFGMYGMQKGDGTPTISNEEQIQITVKAIREWVTP